MSSRTPPRINTYHCLCSNLLLSSTHTLSSLPTRDASSLDQALILPLATPAPALSLPGGGEKSSLEQLPEHGYTTLQSLQADQRRVTVRREDGFERRVVWRCGRCRLVVGYEIESEDAGTETGTETETERERVLYLLPGGLLGTETMASGKKIREGDVELGKSRAVGVGVWE